MGGLASERRGGGSSRAPPPLEGQAFVGGPPTLSPGRCVPATLRAPGLDTDHYTALHILLVRY